MLFCAAGCASTYRAYEGQELPDSSVATVKLADAVFARFNDIEIRRDDHAVVKLLPGRYQVIYRERKTWFRPAAERSGDVLLEAGKVYRLRVLRMELDYVWFWIEDSERNVVFGQPPVR